VDKLWWISYANEKGNLGLNLIPAESEQQAMELANYLGINPGGEVAMIAVPMENYPESLYNRLLQAQDLQDAGIQFRKGGIPPKGSRMMCEDCAKGRKHEHR
jgi:hypothetical protein